ncbi:DUF1028 domain-containing protein [Acidisoma sp. C75]
MTFTIVARCARTGMFGVATSSSSPAVAARCAFAEAQVGAVASQNVTDPALGTRALRLMAAGATAAEALAILARTAPHAEYRQLLAVGADGGSAIYSGARVLGTWGEAKGLNVACAGNLLAHEGVPQAMMEAFLGAEAALGDRLITALRAGLSAGGEAGPVRSAGLKLVAEQSWPVADLRCDWSEDCPIEALARLWALYQPQLEDYVRRALDPRSAPRYGVAGDE